jgi:predicted transcriptional regulator
MFKKIFAALMMAMVAPAMVWVSSGMCEAEGDHSIMPHAFDVEAMAAHSVESMTEQLGLSEEQTAALEKVMATYDNMKDGEYEAALAEILTEEQMAQYKEMHSMAKDMMNKGSAMKDEMMEKKAEKNMMNDIKKMKKETAEKGHELKEKGSMMDHDDDHHHEYKGSH